MFNTEQKKRNLLMIASFIGITVLHFAIVYVAGLQKMMYESAEKLPVKLVAVGMAILVAEIVFIIVARIRKLDVILRGYFLYKLLGIAVFVICLAMRLFDMDLSGTFVYYLFSIWTVSLRPVARLMQIFIGVSEFFRKALLLAAITYIAGSAYLGIKKQQKFEEEVSNRK